MNFSLATREEVQKLLQLSGLENEPSDLLVDDIGLPFFFSPKSCGYCFFHIAHSQKQHEVARFFVAETIAGRFFR